MIYFIFEKFKNGSTWCSVGDERWIEDAKRHYNKGLTVAYKIYESESDNLTKEFDELKEIVTWD